MALDTLIKKFFPVITGLIIAVIAYLQASGVVELVAQSVFGEGEAVATAKSLRPKRPVMADGRPTTKSAAPILARNPFDHETDLDPPPEPPPEADPAEIKKAIGTLDVSDPLNADGCTGVEVHIVTESADPTWSIAVLKGPKEEKAALRRVGDKVEDFEVQYIGYNRLQRSPAVWMSQNNTLCQALLFPVEVEGPAKPDAKVSDAKPAATRAPRPGAGNEVPDEIAKNIEKVSDTEFNVGRKVVDNILENQAQLMKSARIVPEKGADGKTVGIRLFGVRPDTLLGTLGLQNGDRLETINGFNMASPEKALEAYARLRTANKLTIQITRRGNPMTLDFNIQ